MFKLTATMFGRILVTEHADMLAAKLRVHDIARAQNARVEMDTENAGFGLWITSVGPFEGERMGEFNIEPMEPATEPATVVTWFASRDSEGARSDEDRAMAHLDIYKGDSLDAARSALAAAMEHEISYLVEGRYRSSRSLRKAADMVDAVPQVKTTLGENLTDLGHNWASEKVITDGVVWTLTRVERQAQ